MHGGLHERAIGDRAGDLTGGVSAGGARHLNPHHVRGALAIVRHLPGEKLADRVERAAEGFQVSTT